MNVTDRDAADQSGASSATLACYDAHAAQYAARATTSGPLTSLVWRMVSAAGLLNPGTTVLDAGAGPGLDVAALATRGIRAYGVEPSQGMRDQAAKYAPGLVHLGNLGELGVPAASFDVVVSAAALHHLPRHAHGAALTELARAVRTGGGVAVSTETGTSTGRLEQSPWGGQRYYQPSSAQELTELFERAGLDFAVCETDSSNRQWVAVLGYRRRNPA